MYARVARFEGVDTDVTARTIDQTEAIVRPMIETLEGYVGHVELLSAEGEQLAITFFKTEEHAVAAEATFDVEIPRRMGEIFSNHWEGKRVSVGGFSVVVDERIYVSGIHVHERRNDHAN